MNSIFIICVDNMLKTLLLNWSQTHHPFIFLRCVQPLQEVFPARVLELSLFLAVIGHLLCHLQLLTMFSVLYSYWPCSLSFAVIGHLLCPLQLLGIFSAICSYWPSSLPLAVIDHVLCPLQLLSQSFAVTCHVLCPLQLLAMFSVLCSYCLCPLQLLAMFSVLCSYCLCPLQLLAMFSVLCSYWPRCFLLPYNVTTPRMFWSSNIYTSLFVICHFIPLVVHLSTASLA